MTDAAPDDLADFRRDFLPRLKRGGGALESGDAAADLGPLDLSAAAVEDRLQRAGAHLRRLIEEAHGGDPALTALAEKTLRAGREGLELLGGARERPSASFAEVRSGLEVLVRADGSRPSYLVRDGRILAETAAPSLWSDLLEDPLREEGLRATLNGVGRIDADLPNAPYVGTGWLAAPDVIVTNRHVAEVFVDFKDPQGPRLRRELDPRIDFGHEYGQSGAEAPRKILSLLFAGPHDTQDRRVQDPLDLAVFRIAPAEAGAAERRPLALGLGAAATAPGARILVAGYPARPDVWGLGLDREAAEAIDKIFSGFWGYKRLAPGAVMDHPLGPRNLAHDASTLGGNSGSLVVELEKPGVVGALHYGGIWRGDRMNLAHRLSGVMTERGFSGLPYATLQALCEAEGVEVRS